MKIRNLAIALLVGLSLTSAAGEKNAVVVKIDGKFYSTPIVTTDGNVVIASHNKTIYFFNSRGQLQNSYTTGGWIHATPRQLSDGRIAFGCYDKYFYFLDKDGNFLSRIKPGGRIFTEPAEMGDVIAFGTSKGKVAFYNLRTGTTRYAKLGGRVIHGSPLTLSNGCVAIGGNSRKFCIIDTCANIHARLKTKGWIMHTKPAETSENQITIGTYGKRLYSVDSKLTDGFTAR